MVSGCRVLGGRVPGRIAAVRHQGIIHDFVMLNALRDAHAAEAAITLAVDTLRTALNAH